MEIQFDVETKPSGIVWVTAWIDDEPHHRLIFEFEGEFEVSNREGTFAKSRSLDIAIEFAKEDIIARVGLLERRAA